MSQYSKELAKDIGKYFSQSNSLYFVTFSPYKVHCKSNWSWNKSFSVYRKLFNPTKPKVSKAGDVFLEGDPFTVIGFYAIGEYHKDGQMHYHCLFDVIYHEPPTDGLFDYYQRRDVDFGSYIARKVTAYANVKTRSVDSIDGCIKYMTKEVDKTLMRHYDAVIYRKK